MARTFDGTGDGISFARNAAYEAATSAFSLSCWVRRNGAQAQYDRIVDKEYNNAASAPFVSYGLEFALSNAVHAIIGDATSIKLAVGTTALTDLTWTHLCSVLSGGTLTLYINNVSDATVAAGNIIYDTSANGPLDIAFLASGASNAMSGDIAEIGIWNVALDAGERGALAKGVSPLLARRAGLFSYIPLIGKYSPEIDLITGLTGTVSNAVAGAHPRVIMPRRRTIQYGAAAAPSGFQAAWARGSNVVLNTRVAA